jgi:alcohol dehydrogenase class IV
MSSNEIIFGRKQLASLEKILKDYGSQKIFLVTGNKSFDYINSNFNFESIIQDFKTTRYHGFNANPKLEEVVEGINIFKEFKPDIVISIGGGSVIDMAKLINALGSQDTEDFIDIIKTNRIINNGLPLIAIPTTSGTGSESTHFAVVYVDGIKFSLAHPFILPTIAIVDPDLSLNMPKYLAACTGMDALSQAVESYWANGATDESLIYSSEAITLINKSFVKSINTNDIEAKIDMAKAANLAGRAINISKTTAPHAISYGITSTFSIPHGHAVALTLGRFFKINSDQKNKLSNNTLTMEEHILKMRNLFALFDTSSADECFDKWMALMKDISLESSFTALGIKDERKISNVINKINIERLNNNPMIVSKNDLQDLFSV